RQLGWSGRVAPFVQKEREDVALLRACEGTWIVLRHRDADAFEDVAEREPVPVRGEVSARQGRRQFAAGQVGGMAGRAVLGVQRIAALRLVQRVDAVPLRRPGLCGGREARARGGENDKYDQGHRRESHANRSYASVFYTMLCLT